MTEDSTQLLRWMVCGPEVAPCIKKFESFLPFNLEETSKIKSHHEQTSSK